MPLISLVAFGSSAVTLTEFDTQGSRPAFGCRHLSSTSVNAHWVSSNYCKYHNIGYRRSYEPN
jgi:hypothetical protein